MVGGGGGGASWGWPISLMGGPTVVSLIQMSQFYNLAQSSVWPMLSTKQTSSGFIKTSASSRLQDVLQAGNHGDELEFYAQAFLN